MTNNTGSTIIFSWTARLASSGETGAAALYAYDRSGTLLYRLDSDHPVISRHAGGE
jgi:hypothetical protein